MAFSAVLLAGGKSSRMGRDKAALVVDGVPLWQRQLEKLRATGAEEVFISGKPDGPYAGAGVEIVVDRIWCGGPMVALSAALEHCRSEWLLVLAVDMPVMTAEYLQGLAEEAMRCGKAVVPRDDRGRWDPLAAVYPKGASEVVDARLKIGRVQMDELVKELLARGELQPREYSVEERRLFTNWNEPGDVA